MKKIILFSGSFLLVAIPFCGMAQKNNAGVINYEVTIQRPSRNNDQNAGPGNDNGDDAGGVSNVFTMSRTFTFNQNGGKLSSPDFAGMPGRQRRPGGGNAAAGPRQGRGSGGNFRGRGSNEEYVDFAGKKYLQTFKNGSSDTTFYVAQDYNTPENFQTSSKTKKIEGYTCHKATAELRNSTYTIWYTTDIPVNYSPVNGFIPPGGGFVLDLQSDRMEYKATKVQLQAVTDAAVKVPSPSIELTQDQVRDMRRQMMERMRNRNNQN